MEEIGHVYIPAYIMARKDLNLIQKMLFGKIVGLCGKDGYCFASNEWLGNQLDKSQKTISNWISDMVSIGILRREVVRNEKHEIIKRKLFPMFVESGIGMPEIGDRGMPEIGEDIQENYIQEYREGDGVSSKKGKQTTPTKKDNPFLEDFMEWMDTFNSVCHTKFKSPSPLTNYSYWREVYSKEEMLEAVKKIPLHDWLHDKKKPELILRRKYPNGEPCDRIGELLSCKDKYHFV